MKNVIVSTPYKEEGKKVYPLYSNRNELFKIYDLTDIYSS